MFADEPSGIGMYYIDEHGNRVEAQGVRLWALFFFCPDLSKSVEKQIALVYYC